MNVRFARIILSLVFYSCVLLFVVNVPSVYAVDLSTGYYPASTIESHFPSTGWIGSPENIKVSDSVPFTSTYVGINNSSFINTHIEFPILPSNSIIKGFNFRVRAKHDGGNLSGGSPFVGMRKTCTSGTLHNIFTALLLPEIYVTKSYTFTGTAGITVDDINSQTACFIPSISIGSSGVNYFDYFEGEVVYEVPTSIPTPTPIPGPEPFLELPWDYEGKGLTFNEAALAINSFFDHEYPLLWFGNSVGQCPPAPIENPRLTTIFRNNKIAEPEGYYHCHDGYDYGILAKANNGDPVLAAASGIATFVNSCSSCGNIILIDHGNGYQTRYLHLQADGLITNIPGEEITVLSRQKIGQVGATGNVSGANPAHIHFGVFQDKDNDGNFEDNIPDGVTDPFGWQSKEPDPWEIFTFNIGNENKTGNKSYYLWTKKLINLDETLTSNGGVFATERYEFNFPIGSVLDDIKLIIQSSPTVKALDNLRSLGSTIVVNAFDALGNAVTDFTKPFKLTIDFSSIDLSSYDLDAISIYSSIDGINWIKENTIVDFGTETATADIDHLTHFALMAERLDTSAPVTTAVLDGQEGQQNWFRSDVEISLDAEDDILGVDYTLYKKGNGDWETYVNPLVFTEEGHHKIEFYSVDKDENVEEVKSVEFDIDKIAPQIEIDVSPKTIWPPTGKMTNALVTGVANDPHLFSKQFLVIDEYDQIEPIIYDFGQTIQLKAERNGNDLDGRIYLIKGIAEDFAGNVSEDQVHAIVLHDQK